MTPDPANPPRPRKRRLWRWLLLAVGLLVLFPIGVIYSLNWYGEHRFQAELDKIRARGEPVDAAALAEMYEWPESNLTDDWVGATRPLFGRTLAIEAELLNTVPIIGNTELPYPLPSEPWPDRTSSERLLEAVRGSMLTMHDVAQRKGGVHYECKFSEGLSMPREHLSHLQAGVRHLLLEAHLRAHQGDPSGSMDSIHVAFCAARTLESEPMLDSLLVRGGIHQMVNDSIRRLLPAAVWSDSDLNGLQNDLRDVEYQSGLRRAFLAERALGAMTFQDPERILGVPTPYYWKLTRPGDFSAYCTLMTRLIGATGKPWPEALREAEQVDIETKTLAMRPIRIRFIGTLLMLPPLHATMPAVCKNITLNSAADAAIGAELYRRKHGELPEKVEQLVPEFLPEVPLDPFDGQPIRYVVREDKYVFYSVGPDGKDDGAPGPPADDPHGDGPDIEFAVKRKVK